MKNIKNIKKWVSIALAVGMTFGVVGAVASQANADTTNCDDYQPQIVSAQQGETIALLGGDIYKFAANYTKGYGDDDEFTVGDFKGNRYAPKPATLTWENSREGALYYTVKVGTDYSLSNADSYLVSETSVDIEYLFAAQEYYYQIYAHYDNDEVVKSRVFNFRTADLPRTVYVEGVSNTRDMGGRLTVDGLHRVKQGMIYRGGEVNAAWGNITEEGKRVMVQELGIKTDLDLRGSTLTKSPIDDSLKYISVSAPYYTGATEGIMDPMYKEALITEVRTFANPDNYPIYLHCSLGRDRAGTLAFLISALLGVGEMDLYRDYEMSFFSVNGWADAGQGSGQLSLMVDGAFSNLYRYIKNYGKGTLAENTESFMKKYLGITQAEIDTIRATMLEEV